MARRLASFRPARIPAVLLVLAALAGLVPAASARTFVMPHVLEVGGTIANTQNTFDTQIFATYTPGQAGSTAGPGATLDLYLYANTGVPMEHNGQNVCAPCSYALDSNMRKQSIRIDDLISALGPFASGVKLGYGILVVGGADPDGVALQSFVVNSHTSAFDLTTTEYGPQTLGHLCDGDVPAGEIRRTYSFPHVLEAEGRISNTQFTFDTTIFATYVGGQAGIPTGPTGGEATVDLYLFDGAGNLATSQSAQVVCAPCTYSLSPANRKAVITLENEFLNQGGLAGVFTGYAVVVVQGEPDNVNLQGFVVNSHSSAFDVAMTALDPRVVPDNGLVDVPEAGPALKGTMRVTPNPSRAGASIDFTLAREMDVELAIFDVHGRRVAAVWSGRRAVGAQTLPWDGRLDGGALAPAGVYFARLMGEGVLLQNRVIALR